MHPVAGVNVLWIPGTEEEKEMVREQMNRLLQTSHFKNSRRYPALFRFIVEEALEGRGEFLKERLLGVRVFERPPDYDTASDPIVRVTIAEIRKRIAQYYHEEAHDSEMRIELLPGHYEPEFRPRKEPERNRHAAVPASEFHGSRLTATSGLHLPAKEMPGASHEKSGDSSSRRSFWSRYALGMTVMLLLALGILSLWRFEHPPAINEFWAPLLATHGPVLFCMPNGAGKQRSADVPPPDTRLSRSANDNGAANTTPTFLQHESLGENVVFSDALATLRTSNLVATYHRETRFRLDVATTLDDLRQGSAVLIGGMDNQWTMRAIAPLRFHFAGSDDEMYWIADTKDPTDKKWGLDLKAHYWLVNHDYAIIARIHNEATGELEVIVAGIGMSGTAAAGEFLVDPHQLEELRRRVGPGFRDHDFEAVLATNVVNGIAGPPRILTVAVW